MQNRILIVDDEPAMVSILSEFLHLEGFAVETASSAQTAKVALAVRSFDAVITDLRMETPTAGYEVVEAASKQNPRPATVILSAYPALGSQWKLRGAQAFFEKPAPMLALLRKIKELLENNGGRRKSHILTAPSNKAHRTV